MSSWRFRLGCRPGDGKQKTHRFSQRWVFLKSFVVLKISRNFPPTAGFLGFDPEGVNEVHRARNARDLSFRSVDGKLIHDLVDFISGFDRSVKHSSALRAKGLSLSRRKVWQLAPASR
jgi:hypothetical protein